VNPDPYRLPSTTRPRHYELELEPDLEGGTFRGTVRIDLEVAEPVDVLVLNADALDVLRACSGPNGAGREHEVHLDPEHERLHVTGPFAAGEHQLTLEFQGAFNEQLVGFYRSRFTDTDGVERVLATTQFEATHARKCFPCFDEPAMKATFTVSLVVDAAHEAIANTAETDREDLADGRRRIRFAPTIVMSTYLLAFVVGPLEMTEPVDVDGVPLRVVHVPGKAHLTGFALEVGAFALRYFADYFDVAYPGDKVDLVAIPDFAFGAMENLGCITFREVLLLIDPAQATQPELQRLTDVIAHELAHMWFGDLVTMSWWNGLWLNEAFASFMEMKCTDAFRPQWERWVDFGVARTAAFDVDSLAATRPIEFEVHSPQDAEGMFDILTYEKGAAVVRMLEQYLGEERFRDGIREYMRRHAFGNAETTDLWDAIEATVGEPVRRIMDSWIFQGGYPLVGVEIEGSSLRLHQQRFGFVGGDDAEPTTWAVPVRWRTVPTADEPATGRFLLDEPTGTVELPAPSPAVVVNAGATGFYRVRYPAAVLEALADEPERLEAIERYTLLDDAWAAVLAGEFTATGFLVLLEAMADERDRVVWNRIIAGFGALRRLVDDEGRERLAEVVRDLLGAPLTALGRVPTPDEDDLTRQLRGDLFRGAGTIGDDPQIVDDARRIVAERHDPELALDATMVAAAVDVVAAHGDDGDFEAFIEAWRTAATPQDEVRYLYALADFPEPEHAAELHQLVLAGDVRSQNAPYVLRRSLLSIEHGHDTWRFITANWDALIRFLPTNSIVRMLDGITTLDRPEDVAATHAFFEEHPVRQGQQTLRQLLERQRVQLALREREAGRLRAVLLG
jgi:puromycin-sensitive aminopeptidase